VQQLLARDLARFDQQLEAQLQSDPALLGDIGLELIQAGGKRLRPRLSLLTGRLLGAEEGHGQAVAMAVELLHTASLLHDDLIDESETRRGKVAAYRRFGNSISVMAGDYLLAKVLRVLAASGNHDFTLLMSDVATAICEAEIRQFQLTMAEDRSFQAYLSVIDGKTGVLISAALEGVAILAGAADEDRAALREFGMGYGRAFQLQDDYLDLMSDEASLGKPAGSDLAEGKATWPVLLLLAKGNAEAASILNRRAEHAGDQERMAELLRQTGAAEATLKKIAEETGRAAAALDRFPDSPAKAALLELAGAESGRTA